MMMVMSMAVVVMMMVCQIDLFVHLFVCDGTNQMHKLKITDESIYRSRLEINLPQFYAEPNSFLACKKTKKDEIDGRAKKK